MRALVKKEIRLLLPAFAICCGLTCTNLLAPEPLTHLFFVACPMMVVVMAMKTFGAEVDSGLFAGLLAQPIPRKTIWNTKILLLALAMAMIALFWCATFAIEQMRYGLGLDTWRTVTIVGLVVLVIFSGSLWTVLLLRQVALAFWLTLLIPMGIAGCVQAIAKEASDFSERMMALTLALYSMAGYAFARWLFLRAQDVQWSGGNLTMPEVRAFSRLKIRAGTGRRWSPLGALWVKEFHLHESQFIFAGILLLLHLAVIAIRHWSLCSPWSVAGYTLDNLWTLWLVLPLLLGSAAVAEERRLGTLDTQLCLPVRRRTQFIVKISGVLLLSLVFGAVVPLLLEPQLLWSFSPDFPEAHEMAHHWRFYEVFGARTLLPREPLHLFAAGVAAVGLISFYASSLSRNTLRALSLALLGILVGGMLVVFMANPNDFFLTAPKFWQGLAGCFLTVAALVALASWNLQHSIITRRMVFYNVLTLLAVAVFITFVAHMP
jgi:ABC-type transport system involved in multi-copper enzyme maturation permease subunit